MCVCVYVFFFWGGGNAASKNNSINEAMDIDHYLLGVFDFRLHKSLMYNNFEHLKCSNTTLKLCAMSYFLVYLLLYCGKSQ